MTDEGMPRPIDVLPHRYPFLLVDEVTSIDREAKTASGRWHLTGDEPFFAGHFPDYPVLPGVLMVEALAQLGAAAGIATEGDPDDLPLLAGVDKARFRRQVVPGDVLDLHVELTHRSARAGKVAGRATVDGDLACRVEIMFVVARWSEVLGPQP